MFPGAPKSNAPTLVLPLRRSIVWLLPLLLNYSGVNHLLYELGVQSLSTPVIYFDNISAIYLCANPIFHSLMKHLAVDFHFVRNLVQDQVFRVTHVSSYDQVADALTKPVPDPRLHDLYAKIDLTSKIVLWGRDKE